MLGAAGRNILELQFSNTCSQQLALQKVEFGALQPKIGKRYQTLCPSAKILCSSHLCIVSTAHVRAKCKHSNLKNSVHLSITRPSDRTTSLNFNLSPIKVELTKL